MKKFIKNNNELLPFDIEWLIYDNLSDVPNDLVNANVIVRNDGIYKCNGSTKTKVVNNRHNEKRRVGEVKLFYGNTIPTGWLECNGQTFSQSSYPLLYTYLGNSTTVPDYRELALAGTASGQNWWYDRVGAHTHSISNLAHTHTPASSSHKHSITFPKVSQNASGGDVYRGLSPSNGASASVISTSNEIYVGTLEVASGSINPTIGGRTGDNGQTVGNVTRDRQIGVRFIICAQE